MFSRVLKWSVVAILCAVLIGGSFSQDNFGLTQTLSAPDASYSYPGIFIVDGAIYRIINSGEAPEKGIEFKLPVPSDSTLIILTTLVALMLALPHLIPAKRKHASIVMRMQATGGKLLGSPPWKVELRRRKDFDASGIAPKRHIRLSR